jgi:hypothetical protein
VRSSRSYAGVIAMATETWGISRLNDNPPKQVPWYPKDDSKEYITYVCELANEKHRQAGTKEVFKVFKFNH